eukprot:1147711-Amphidinium_carterae.2
MYKKARSFWIEHAVPIRAKGHTISPSFGMFRCDWGDRKLYAFMQNTSKQARLKKQRITDPGDFVPIPLDIEHSLSASS